MSASLKGAVAVVTGSTSGIGHAVATRLAADGARVVVNSRDLDRAAAVAAELVAAGHEAVGVGADVRDPDQARRLVAAAVDAFGGLDVLVNNAGVPLVRPAEAIMPDEWADVVGTNLTGPFLCSQAAAAVMLERGAGVIVNVSSILGHVAIPGRAAYVAAKHGLEGLTRALAVEWAARGVRVVGVSPGYVATPLVTATMAAGAYAADDIERRTPLGRLAAPAEVADVVAFLASGRAAYVTGTSVAVDGGWLAYGGW